MKWQAGYGLNAIRGVSQRSPRSASCGSRSIALVDERVVDAEAALEHARRALRAELRQPRGEQCAVRGPGGMDRLRRRRVVEVREEARRHAAGDAERARRRVGGASPPRRAAAAVAPKIPQIAVGWKPRLWNAPGAAMPTRVTISLPAIDRRQQLATARAARLGERERRRHDHGRHVRRPTRSACRRSRARGRASRSRRRRSAPAGRSSSPITDASGSPPSSDIAVRPSAPIPRPCAARPQPRTSSTCSFAASTTGGGTVVEVELERPGCEPLGGLHTVHSSVRAREAAYGLRRRSLVDHERAPVLDHDLAALVDAAAAHGDDADVGVRLRLALLEDLALRPQRVADEDRARQLDVRPLEVRGGVLARVRHGHAGDQREREGAVDEDLAELRPLGVRPVEVDRVRVVRQAGEEQVVLLGDGAAEAARGRRRRARSPRRSGRARPSAPPRGSVLTDCSFRRLSRLCQTSGRESSPIGERRLDPRLEVRHKRRYSIVRQRRSRGEGSASSTSSAGWTCCKSRRWTTRSPAAGEVLIDIAASALNHLDVDIREGVSRFDVAAAVHPRRRGRRAHLGARRGRRPAGRSASA